ncbi:MAG: M20/M25/M40 family metallo-hydrolase [Planctomycetota bacterium]
MGRRVWLATALGVWVMWVGTGGCATGSVKPVVAERSSGGERVAETIAWLTDERLGGRVTGGAEEQATAEWLEAELRGVGWRGAFRFDRALLTFATEENGHAVNVCLALEPTAAEAVVLVAHYDGQGVDEATGEVRPGADDNASGVAAVLEAARRLAAWGASTETSGGRPVDRTVIVLLTSAEEVGLQGARVWSALPDAYAVAKPVAVVNLDMVGRLGDRPLGVYGTETDPGWWGWVGEASRASGVRVARHEGFPGSGDHDVFAEVGVPTVLLHTGNHTDRHTPRDTPERVDIDGVARVAEFTTALVRQLAVAPELAAPPAGASTGVE